MSSKMLIDAAHPEETRVVVVRGNRLEDFDYESATRKQLRGNIYLAKVTRVEPSLQAAFVDYGGNRHGFLAFNEIHPDYYQIPVADRQALLDKEAEDESKAQAEEAAHDDAQSSRRGSGRKKSRRKSAAKSKAGSPDGDVEDADAAGPASDDAIQLASSDLSETVSEDAAPPGADTNGGGEAGEDENGESVELIGSEDALEELPVRARRSRYYKIQEVIKRRQIILVQVVKEERGNKGAALTTYISLAGRYTVLMPNTARGGGISRKITNPADRKRLRKIASDLDVAQGMGLIIRTAGASRTKAEIKRDFEYLLRMWENIRDLTLQSTAPTLVYEEGNLIKRSIRDLYGKEIDGITVAGEEAYKEAKAFMRLLMPSHAKNVQPYKDPEPIFVRHQIERQLGAMYSPHVTLKSGGYIVINQTEALVSVDVNSGKSTREHSIESTALRTNLEAADEVARQLRLRDLAGLIVIDFIDMEERRNNRAVERKMKEALKSDRARIQVGRISHFGLMEMSRQRLRAGVLEGSTAPCTMCQGTGIVRSTESVALDILRTVEDTLLSEGATNLVVSTSYEIALYILNQKRSSLRDIESRYDVSVTLSASDELHGGNFTIERGAATAARRSASNAVVHMDSSHHEEGEEEASDDDRKRSRRKRRRRGRGDRDEVAAATGEGNAAEVTDNGDAGSGGEAETPAGDETEDRARRPRRRGRRGGRRTRGSRSGTAPAQAMDGETPEASETAQAAATAEEPVETPAEPVETPAEPVETPAEPVETPAEEPVEAPAEAAGAAADIEKKPKRRTRRASAKTTRAKADDGEDAKADKKPATRSRRKPARKAADGGKDSPPASAAEANGDGSAVRSSAPKKSAAKSGPAKAAETPVPAAPKTSAADPEDARAKESGDDAAPPKRGWWQQGV